MNQEQIIFILNILQDASKLCMQHFGTDFKVEYKSDNSPVSEIDVLVNDYICKHLIKLGFPIVSEEGEKCKEEFAEFFLIDPIDGTRSFISNREDFSINLAFISNGKPIYGFIVIPAEEKIYYNLNNNQVKVIEKGVERAVKPICESNIYAAVSRTHLNKLEREYLEELDIEIKYKCSSAAKFAYLFEGLAAIYPKFVHIGQWDVAAAHAILNALGGQIKTKEGDEIIYTSKDKKMPYFVASTAKLQNLKLYS